MRRMILAAMLAGVLSNAANAHAADKSQVQEATALFEEGRQLMHRKDYEHARVKFLAASALVTSYDATWNLGYCEIKSEHFLEGIGHIRQAVHMPSADPKDVQYAKDDLLPNALAKVGQIQIDAREGTRVMVDGKDAGSAPFADSVAVAAGDHHVEARLGDQVIPQRDVHLDLGQLVVVHLVVPATEAPPAPVPVPTPATEPAPQRAPPSEVSPATGLTTGRKVAIGLGAGAVVAAGVGIALGFVAKGKSANAASSFSCTQSPSSACTNLRDSNSTARSDAAVATVLDVAGGALAAAAIVTWLVSAPSHEGRVGLHVEPALGPSVAGIRLGGEF